MNKNIIPVLLGGDLNAYSVALAFKEAYGVTSHAFVRYKCGATENSHFIKTHTFPELDCAEAAVPELLNFANRNSGSELYLIPCQDRYVEMLMSARSVLSGIFKIHMPDIYLWRKLSNKESFYNTMKEEGIPFPEFASFKKGEKPDIKLISSFEYPAVLKPSDGNSYWRHPFPEMQKVYFPKNPGEASGLIYKIFDSGYDGSLILQMKVGGEDDNYVLTCVSDGRGRVIRAVLGKVILEETGKTSIGNHSAIVTRPLDKISYRLIDYLNKVGYRGIANFDIIHSKGECYVLELNPRQGRSCDYLRAAGVNIAELFVKIARGEEPEANFTYKEIYWHYPPNRSVMKYSAPDESLNLSEYERRGESYSPYKNPFEGIRRRVYVMIHDFRLGKTLKNNFRKGVK